MKTYRLIGLATITVLLASCGPATVTVPWRAGVNFAQVDAVNTQCEVLALRQVPQAISTSTTPIHRTPSNVICNQIGNQTFCNEYGGQTYGGNTVTSDLNESLRGKVKSQCLANYGIQMVTLPLCSKEQAKKGVSSPVLPPASRVECLTKGGYVPK